MQNEEIIIAHNSDKVCHLYIKRKWHFVECLSRVMIWIDGIEMAVLSNSEDVVIPVQPGSIIDLDLQSRSWHNYYKVVIAELPRIEFSYSWFGTGSLFKYNNIRLLSHSGCRITETGKEFTSLQKLDIKFRIIAISVCLFFYIVLYLSRCHIRIHW